MYKRPIIPYDIDNGYLSSKVKNFQERFEVLYSTMNCTLNDRMEALPFLNSHDSECIGGPWLGVGLEP